MYEPETRVKSILDSQVVGMDPSFAVDRDVWMLALYNAEAVGVDKT